MHPLILCRLDSEECLDLQAEPRRCAALPREEGEAQMAADALISENDRSKTKKPLATGEQPNKNHHKGTEKGSGPDRPLHRAYLHAAFWPRVMFFPSPTHIQRRKTMSCPRALGSDYFFKTWIYSNETIWFLSHSPVPILSLVLSPLPSEK